MPIQKLTTEMLNAAIAGFELQRHQIDAQIAEIRQMLDGGRPRPAATPEVAKGKRRTMSTAARKRMGDAQRKRWAESKRRSESPATTVTPKPKRKMSAAGRKAISDATKKRWAAFHAAAKKSKSAVTKTSSSKRAATKKKTAKAHEAAATATAR